MKKYILVIIAAAIHANTFGGSVEMGKPGISGIVKMEHDQKAGERPNVIIVLSDDQGYGDFSCHGNPVLKTPALDKLHDESIRFSDFHVSPLCTPTRGQLLTGVDALRNKAATVLTARNIIKRDLVTMPEIFLNNGYATGIFGKWHLGDAYPDRPMDKGFQKCIWHKGWGLRSEIEFDNDYYETRYLDNHDVKYSNKYCTNLWFDKAMSWMEEMASDNKPFFSYIALNAPHGPFDSPKQDYDVYRNEVDDQGTASFLGMIRNIDRNMARLDHWLETNDLKENTILIYMNDNGTAKGELVYNANMRGKKGSNYEGGHRAACLFHWPDRNIISSQTISFPTQIQDVFPTLIDILKLKIDPATKFDGISLKPYLTSGDSDNPDRMLVVQYGGSIAPEKYFCSVIWNSWRLVGENELYNIDSDIAQENNVASLYPNIHHKMKTYYEQWWKEIELEVNQFVPIIIDSDFENSVVISSNSWENGAINTQWAVASGSGPARGGISHLNVVNAGIYRISISRWPFHLNKKLDESGLSTSIGGTEITKGKALPVNVGCILINGDQLVEVEMMPGATSIPFEIKLHEGNLDLQAWFKDEVGNDICGAYYVKLEKVQ